MIIKVTECGTGKSHWLNPSYITDFTAFEDATGKICSRIRLNSRYRAFIETEQTPEEIASKIIFAEKTEGIKNELSRIVEQMNYLQREIKRK